MLITLFYKTKYFVQAFRGISSSQAMFIPCWKMLKRRFRQYSCGVKSNTVL